MKRSLLTLLALTATGISAYAGEPSKTIIVEEPKSFCDLWDLATLYKDDENPFIQEFKLRGRYQGQYHWLDSEQGDDNGWEDRRSRFGFDAKLFDKKIEVRLDAQSSDEFDPFYNGLVDAFIKWKPTKELAFTFGRQKPQIGYYDFLQSTNNQPTFERSQIFNQLRVDRVVGALAEYKTGPWFFQSGIYSNDIDLEFGGFDAGVAFGAGVGYDFAEATGLKKSEIRFDYLHSDIQAESTILNRYEDLFSGTLWLKDGPWSLVTEAFFGTGNTPDVGGFFIQPTYDLIPEKLQLVGRYSHSSGDGADSTIAQSRYERLAPLLTDGGRGETYNAGYLGLQYFICGDKLKLLAGAEYANQDGGGDNGGDYDGWTYLTGVRFSF